jgi:arginase family enzyme
LKRAVKIKKIFSPFQFYGFYLIGLPKKALCPMYDLNDYLIPVNAAYFNNDINYSDSQFGSNIKIYEENLPDLDKIDIVLIGVNEFRGEGFIATENSADAIREQFYRLHYWHTDVSIADLGNVKSGDSLADSYSAAKIVIEELLKLKKTVVILGGSHDNTLAQYNAYKSLGKIIEATIVDAKIDLNSESMPPSENFLMEMLTEEPNMVRQYNHIGFQSYFVSPKILETIDKLRFDCFRVGMAKEEIDEMEPVIRNTDLMSFDISAIKNSDSPASQCSPNGFTGEEACSLARYAGMSQSLSSFGIYGYDPVKEMNGMTALQISQMLWYFIDGKSRSKQESLLGEHHNFNEYHTYFAEIDTVFLQSKRTGRWWMQMPDKNLTACSYNDYLMASNNEIPERWMRIQERDV